MTSPPRCATLRGPNETSVCCHSGSMTGSLCPLHNVVADRNVKGIFCAARAPAGGGLVQLANSGESIRGGLEARRRLRCEMVCDTGGLATPIQLSSLPSHTLCTAPCCSWCHCCPA